MTREEGKEFANALKNNYTIDFDKIPDFCDLVISALSTEPKKGEWTKESLCGYRCNQCGKIQMADDINELNFCCNCGADMRGE